MYNIGFRKAALIIYNYFHSLRKASRILNVSISTLSRWNCSIEIKPRVRQSIQKSDAIRSFVSTQVINNPCITCPLLCYELNKHFDLNISRQLVHLIVKQCSFSFKRIRTRCKSNKKEEKTKAFIDAYKQNAKQNNLVVSIDESGFDHRAHQVYGYAPKGKPAIIHCPYSSDRKRYNLILAICSNGEKYFEIHIGPVTSAIYSKFIKNLPFPKNACLLMDNATIHRTKVVLDSIQHKEHQVIFTPPYGPEYAAIELVFGQIKNRFYKLRFNMKGNLESLIRKLTNEVTSSDIMNSFRHVCENYIYV